MKISRFKKTRYNLSYIFFIFAFCLTIISGHAQNDMGTTDTFWNDVRFGGGIGLSFGNGFFSGTLAPSAIYQFNRYVALGVGLNGTYNSSKNYYKSTIFGGSVLGLFNPLREVQLSAEFEELKVNRNWETRTGIEDQKYWYPALFLGAGYNTGSITVGIRYDVLYKKEKSIYADSWAPFVRVYF
ncbi:hypothetical protein SAMN03097699_2380 [Flavobacteriaceae bacterium MAR_2010_188]|nr:hypothetical protein SAMN03097699_2380 [Flavobacteriaceae bacterium MAR_2010_188]